MGLQTEYGFTLPKGFVGHDGTLHRRGVMRLSTARDEIEPLRDPRITGPDDPYLTILVIARVITELGTLDQVTDREVEGLFAADEPAALHTRDRWHKLLLAAGYPVRSAPSVAACEWRKSLWTLAVSGLCAAFGERNGAILDSPPLHALARELLQEARLVAAAEGVALTDDDLERVFAITESNRDGRNTMVQDLARGQATEMPFLNLAVARMAVRHGLFAPVNAVVARLVEHCERRGPPGG